MDVSQTFRDAVWRLIQAALAVVLLGIIVFFGLTRTEVGRDGLRREIQTRFNDALHGRLEIEELNGNLVSDLYASTVRLYDPDGQPIVEVDSVVIRPRWRALLSGNLSMRTVVLIEPHVTLRRSERGTWNIKDAFTPRDTSASAPSSFAFSLATLRIEDGTLETINAGARPNAVREGWVFDYTDASVRSIQADATIEWGPETKLIDVFGVSADLPDPNVTITSMQGQVVRLADGWSLNDMRAQTDQSDVQVNGSYDLPDVMRDAAAEVRVLDLDLQASRLDLREMRRLVPRLPIAGSVRTSARLRGPIDNLLVESFSLARGQSELNMEGTIIGLPRYADYEIDISDSQLATEDLRTILPNANIPDLSHLEAVDVSLYSRGVGQWGDAVDSLRLDAQSELRIAGVMGAVAGSLRVAVPRAAPVQYDARLVADSVDVGRVLQRTSLASVLNGTFNVEGQGLTPDSAVATADIALAPSEFGGQGIDSLQVALRTENRQTVASFTLDHSGPGLLTAEGEYRPAPGASSYRLQARARNLNLAAIPPTGMPGTALNAELDLTAQGDTWADLQGDLVLAFDTSGVIRTDSTVMVPPVRTQIRMQPRSTAGPRLQLSGDVAEATLSGDVALEPIVALGRMWSTALTEAVQEEIDKPYPRSTASSADVPPSASASYDPPVVPDERRAAVRALLADAGFPLGLSLDIDASIKRPDILHALLPSFPDADTSLTGGTRLRANADSLSVEGRAGGAALAVGALRGYAMEAEYMLTGSLDAPLVETLQLDVNVAADSLQISGFDMRSPALTLSYHDRQGSIKFASASDNGVGPFRLAAALNVQPSQNELLVRDLYAAAEDYAWEIASPALLTLYADAILLDPVTLYSPRLYAEGLQQINVRGRFSDAPSDTVYVEADNVLIYPFSQMARTSKPLGGLMNGDLSFTGGFEAPQLAGNLTVDRLSFDRRLLGHLAVQSSYDPGSPDILLDLSLVPADKPMDDAERLVPRGIRAVEENRLDLSGRIRVREALAESASGDVLNLDLDVERADLFFFEYIFNDVVADVSGFTSGTGTIRGSFTDPLFNADMRVTNGLFEIPRFGLNYEISGPVEVNEEGIFLRDVSLQGTDRGTATINGGLLFNNYQYFSFDLRGRLDELPIIDVSNAQDLPFYGTIWATGPLSLTGPLYNATLRSNRARTTPDSELYIPVTEDELSNSSGFIIFADSTGSIPDFQEVTRRRNLLADRPAGETSFLDGLELELNITAPDESTVHLVFDPLIGDVVTAIGSGRVQLQRQEGEFLVYGTFEVDSGDYLFTAGEVFVRRFNIDQGTLTWDGDPVNARLDLDASYRTRASTAGLSGFENQTTRIPVVVQLDIGGRVETPRVDLSLALERDERGALIGSETLDTILNQSDQATEYATSVLLTNTFLLTTASTQGAAGGTAPDAGDRLASAGGQLAFNSVSQLVASQLNRYLSAALPNVDFNFGLQGESSEDLDVVYGIALRLLNERLIIRGEGVYTGDDPQVEQASGPQGEFVVEVRLNPQVSVEVFYRRAGDELTRGQTLTSTTGAALSYQTEFSTWRRLFNRLFGWLAPGGDSDAPSDPEPPVAEDAGDAAVRDDGAPRQQPDDASDDPDDEGPQEDENKRLSRDGGHDDLAKDSP